MNYKRLLVISVLTCINTLYAKKYFDLDPQVAQFINQLDTQNAPPIYTLTPQAARKVLDDLQKNNVNRVPALVQDITIPGKITPEISLRIVRPTHAKGKLPVIIYVHGGGWILGNKETHDYLIRQLANQAQAAVVFVNYTPSPEAQYPVAIEQAYEAADYIAKNSTKYSLDGSRMAIAGDSVGGGMATEVALRAKKRGGPKFLYQALFYPVTDANFETDSYNKYANGPWLTKKAMQWFWDAYAPTTGKNAINRNSSDIAPLQASLEELAGLPPALVITDHDVLRDEGQAYAIKLMQAGVPTTSVEFLGTIHDFAMLAPLKDTPTTKSAIELAATHLKNALRSK